jgi:hypothetical protein
MNKLSWIWVLLLTLFQTTYGQEPVAVITDIQQEIKLYPSLRSILSEQSFPDYFTSDRAWQQSILQELQTQISKKLGVKEVYVADSSALVTFAVSGSPLPSKLKFTGVDRASASYFAAFTSTIVLTTTAVEEGGLPVRHYNCIAEIKIEDKDRRQVFTNRISIPFRTAVSLQNGLYGEREMSEKDSKELFSQAVVAVFHEKVKRLPLRTYYRPTMNEPKYQPFLTHTRIYILQELARSMPAQRGQPHKTTFLYQDHKTGKTYNIDLLQLYTGSLQSPDNTYACRVDVSEEISQTDSQLWMHLNWLGAAVGNVQASKAEVQIRWMSQGLLAGDFVLNARKMEGMVGYQVYTLNRINPKDTYELVANNKLLALIQKAGTGKAGDSPTQDYALYIHKDISQERQGELATIFLMYKVAAEFAKDFL